MNDFLYFSHIGSISYTYHIYSIQGKLLQQGTLNNTPIDVSLYKPNIYLIKLSSSYKTTTQKFTIK
ncbi:T9SS type A sorting domain-containing protein [Psychroflexus sp. CCL10W]|nr:T9SS type A sorting domain-containing protein [Psychroflexus montanilacus]